MTNYVTRFRVSGLLLGTRWKIVYYSKLYVAASSLNKINTRNDWEKKYCTNTFANFAPPTMPMIDNQRTK